MDHRSPLGHFVLRRRRKMSSANIETKTSTEIPEVPSSELFREVVTAWKVIKLSCLDLKKLTKSSRDRLNTQPADLKRAREVKTSSTLPSANAV